MKVKIKTGFSHYTDSNLLVKAQTIHDSTELDPTDYPSPVPSLASGQTKINLFSDSLADRGGKAKTAAKNQARVSLVDFLNALALYVQQNCGNDEETALNSGFDIWKSGSPIGDLPKPTGFTIGAGSNSGEVFASMNSFVSKAKSYVYEYSQVENTWITVVSSTPKVLIIGLESGKRVSVRGAGVGASKHLVWSNTISIYVM
jgi:hypothetical protein